MKKLLLLALLMLALVVTAVACTDGDTTNDTTVGDTTVETPTEAPTEAPTEDATEGTTETPTEEATEAPTEEATEAPTEQTTEESTEEPTQETVDIDLTTVTATGSWPTVDVPVNAPALGLGEDQHVISLHYGSIVLGEMDLSKFTKVTVTYVTPCGELNGSNFNTEYEATGKRVLLLNTLSAIQEGTTFEMLPAEDAIITTNHYEMSSVPNEVKTVEIDLTEIDYNGQVILSFDARNANNEFGAIGYLVYVTGITFA